LQQISETQKQLQDNNSTAELGIICLYGCDVTFTINLLTLKAIPSMAYVWTKRV